MDKKVIKKSNETVSTTNVPSSEGTGGGGSITSDTVSREENTRPAGKINPRGFSMMRQETKCAVGVKQEK